MERRGIEVNWVEEARLEIALKIIDETFKTEMSES
jgi:hypothetical protein